MPMLDGDGNKVLPGTVNNIITGISHPLTNIGSTFTDVPKFMECMHAVMQIENPDVWAYVSPIVKLSSDPKNASVIAAWAEYDNTCISVYNNDGEPTYGFGTRHPHKEVPARVVDHKGKTWKKTNFLKYKDYKNMTAVMYSGEGVCKPGWSPTSVVVPYDRGGSIANPLKVAYSTSLFWFRDTFKYLREHLNTLPEWNNIFYANTMTIGELCALTDFGYNTGYWTAMLKTGVDNGANIRKAVMNHQAAKVGYYSNPATVSAADLAKALKAVETAFYSYGAGRDQKGEKVKLPGLLKRRALEFDMYSGRTLRVDRTETEINNIIAGLGVTLENMVVLSADDSKRISAASSVWSTVMGSDTTLPDDVINAIETGQSMDEILKLMQKHIQDRREEIAADAKALAANDNGRKEKTETPISISIDNINLHPIADGRSLTGMAMHTTTRHTAAEENSRNRKNLTQQIGAFKKYGQVNDDDLGQAKTTLFFMTRPEMCLYQNTVQDQNSSDKNFFEPSLQMRDPDLIDHLKIDRNLYIMLDRHIKPDFTETNIAFIPAFTNQFRSATPPEVNFEFDKSAANIHGVALSLPVYNSSDSADTSIPVTFNVDNDLSVMKYVDIMFKYAKSKKEGLTLPWKNVLKYNVIDFTTTIFMFTVGQDGVTLESWERSVGVIPANNPLSSIPKNSQPEKMESVNINFKTNTNLDSRKISVIHHFNFLNRIGCSELKAKKVDGKFVGEIRDYDTAIDWYMTNYNLIETWVQDNMEYEDWYCERYQIFLDTDGVYFNYKIVGIPTWKRLQKILDKFTSDTRLKKLIRSDESKSTAYKLRFSKNSNYYKYGLNTKAFEDITAYKTEKEKSQIYDNMITSLDVGTKVVVADNRKKTSSNSFSDSIGLGHRRFDVLGTAKITTTDISGKQTHTLYDWRETSSETNTLQKTTDWKSGTVDAKHKGVSEFNMTVDKDNNYNVTADGKTFKFDKFKYDLFIAPRKSTTYFSNNTMFNEKTGLFIMKDNDEIYTKGIMDAFTLQQSVPYVEDFTYDKTTTISRRTALDLQYGRFMLDGYDVSSDFFLESYLKYMAEKYKEKYEVSLSDEASSNPGDWRLDIVPTKNLYIKDSRVGGSAPYIKDGKAYRKQVKIVKDPAVALTSKVQHVLSNSTEYMNGIGQESPSMLGNGQLGVEIIDLLDTIVYSTRDADASETSAEMQENAGGYFYNQMFLYLTNKKTNQFMRYISEKASKIDMQYTMMDVAGISQDITSRDNVVYNSGGVSYTDGGMVVTYMNKNTMFGDDYVKQLEETEKDKADNASLNSGTNIKQKQLLNHFEEKKIPIFPDSSTTIRIGAWGFNIGAMADSIIDTAKTSLANWAANNLSSLVTKKLTELVVGKDNLNKDKHDNSKFSMSDKDLALLAKLKGYESLSVDTKNAESVSYTEYQEPELTDNEDLSSEEYIEKPVESNTEFSKIEPLVAEEKYIPIQFVDMYTYKDDNNSSFKLDIDDKTLKAINSLLKKRNVNDFDEEYNSMISSTEKTLAKLEGSVKYVDMFKLIGDNLISLELEAIPKERFDIETDTDVDDIKYKESLEKLANLENMKIVRDNPIPEERRNIKTNDSRDTEFVTEYSELVSGEKLKFVRENPIQSEDFDVETDDLVYTEQFYKEVEHLESLAKMDIVKENHIPKERLDIETDTDVDDIKYKESLDTLSNLDKMEVVRNNPIPEEDFSVEMDHLDFKERFDTFLNKLYNMEKMSMVRDNPIPVENPRVEKRNEDIVMNEKSISYATDILSSKTGSKISTLNKTASDNMLGVYTRVTDMLTNTTMYDMYVDNKKVFDDAMTMYTRSTTGNINKISGSTTDVSDIILAALE